MITFCLHRLDITHTSHLRLFPPLLPCLHCVYSRLGRSLKVPAGLPAQITLLGSPFLKLAFKGGRVRSLAKIREDFKKILQEFRYGVSRYYPASI